MKESQLIENLTIAGKTCVVEYIARRYGNGGGSRVVTCKFISQRVFLFPDRMWRKKALGAGVRLVKVSRIMP
jgi:hypothetical protein